MEIAEKYEKSRQDKSESEIKNDKADYRNQKRKEIRREGHSVDYTEKKEDAEGQAEVDERGYITREEEEILRDIDFREDGGIGKKRVHSSVRRLVEEGENNISAEEISRIMLDRSAKKLCKHDTHYKKRQKRREYAPKHSEIGALIFFLKIALHKFCKEEAMLT